MLHVSETSRSHAARGGWTLVEILVGVSIMLVLFGTVAFSSRIIQRSRHRATAQAQIRLIATAIDQYADFWPKWQVGPVLVAEKGWPDFAPGRTFAICVNGGVYETIANFNDFVDYVAPDWIDNPVGILNANTTLAFQLLAASGKGQRIQDRTGAGLRQGADFVTGATRLLYPGFDSSCVTSATGAARTTEVFVDPWGQPLRYFWVYRDASRTAYRGYLPVDFGPFQPNNSAFGVLNTEFNQPAFPAATQLTVGYVIESAGPDGRFGNLWKINPTQQEIDDAADNVTISP